VFVNKNGLGRFPEFRDQGVGGSNPLSPTNYFQSLTILQIRQTEPLVRLFMGAPTQLVVSVEVSPGLQGAVGAPNWDTHKNLVR